MLSKASMKSVLSGLVFLISTASVSVANTDKPVVVELFTSQGCSACPPAEYFLNKLSKRDDVIALSYHVDYWDYIGWEDPFADAAFTQRQREYVKTMGGRYVYTPQMVINGVDQEVGSRMMSVDVMIEQQRENPIGGKLTPKIELQSNKGQLLVDISSPLHFDPTEISVEKGYDIVVVTYDEEHVTEVLRGENRGKEITNRHVVRKLRIIGEWSPVSTKIKQQHIVDISGMPGDGGCVVMIQERGTGAIIAAEQLPMNNQNI